MSLEQAIHYSGLGYFTRLGFQIPIEVCKVFAQKQVKLRFINNPTVITIVNSPRTYKHTVFGKFHDGAHLLTSKTSTLLSNEYFDEQHIERGFK